jgi:protoporphyrinogen oxidase
MHLGFAPDDVPDGLPGFGWLVHSDERADVLGCLWVSGVFPDHAPDGHHLVRFMVGGTRAPTLAQRDDEALIAHARDLLAQVQGVRAEPVLTHVNRASIPQYPPGFARRLRLLDQLDPRVDLLGWHWGQLGVAASARAAYRTVRRLRGR